MPAAVILNLQYSNSIKNSYLENFLRNCPQVNATGTHWWLSNICWYHQATKPLAEPMSTKYSGAIWHYYATINWQVLCIIFSNNPTTLIIYQHWSANVYFLQAWWRHKMETLSTELTTCDSPHKVPVMWSFVALLLVWKSYWTNNKVVWWFESPWRHSTVTVMVVTSLW